MATLTTGQTARTIAMAGCARAGSARAGYVPHDPTNSAGTATTGAKVFYSSVYHDDVTYTVVKQ